MLGFEKVRFVNQEDDASAAFMLFGGQQILGLGDQLCLEAARQCSQGAHDGDVQAADADGLVSQVHDVVRRLIELADGGAYRDGLTDADLAGDDPSDDSAIQKRMRATASW